jgi:hypothetical protein
MAILNSRQTKEMEEAAKPLIKWLNENCHPHVVVIVDPGSAELLEGIARIKCEEFIKD